MHNDEWSLKENAYCLIRLLEWREKDNLRERDAMIADARSGRLLANRSEDAIRLHFEYLDAVVGGKPTQLEQDQYLVGVYRRAEM